MRKLIGEYSKREQTYQAHHHLALQQVMGHQLRRELALVATTTEVMRRNCDKIHHFPMPIQLSQVPSLISLSLRLFRCQSSSLFTLFIL